MKKILLTSILVGAVASTFAQGYINFGNSSTTTVATNGTQNYLGQTFTTPVGSTGNTLGSGAAPQGFYYALLYQSYSGTTAGNSITSLGSEGWAFAGIYATNSLASGRFSGGTDVSVAGCTAGNNYQFVVVGWTANETVGGPNWSTIATALGNGAWANMNGYVGISSVGIINGIAGAPPSPASSLFGSSPGITSPFTLYSVQPVPEPGTLALAALGGASLLLFRRKK